MYQTCSIPARDIPFRRRNCSGATETISLFYIISLHVSAFFKVIIRRCTILNKNSHIPYNKMQCYGLCLSFTLPDDGFIYKSRNLSQYYIQYINTQHSSNRRFLLFQWMLCLSQTSFSFWGDKSFVLLQLPPFICSYTNSLFEMFQNLKIINFLACL